MDTKVSDNALLYQEKKKTLQKQLEDKQGNVSLYKSTSNLFRSPIQEKKDKKIDVRMFNKVIRVDAQQLIAEVEGMTTYEDLVNETLKHGCLPTVVPELKSITIGGALSGCGIESSSFRYGLVHETIKEAEVLLSNGTIVRCDQYDNSDLFYALPNCYGTLGYVLKVKVQLIPAKKYVKLSHERYSHPGMYFKEMERLCEENRVDYIDGVIFDRNEMYITTGEFVDEVPRVSHYTFMDIFYQSIQKKPEDYLTTLEYIWRWDTDWFWCSKVFHMQNPITRFLLGKWLLGSKTFTKIMHYINRHPKLDNFIKYFRPRTESVIQDVLIPVQHATNFLEFHQNEIGIKPIWICPTKSFSKENRFDFCPLDPNTLYIDFGFWDTVPSNKEEGYYNRLIEKKSMELGGFKSLYSSNYYTPEQFWSLFNQSRYNELKQKYDADKRLRGLYEKVTHR